MKKAVKIFAAFVGIIFCLFLVMVGGFWYRTKYRYTDIETQISPDERCRITLQMKGEPEWPFGSTYGRIIVRYDDGIIRKFDFVILDDGAMLRRENWDVVWAEAGVRITLKGSEQDNQMIEILYDGTEEFYGYSEEQITAEMEKRYGGIRACEKKGELYCYDTGEFIFLVQNDLVMSDNYKEECYRYLTDTYFAGRNRAHKYEESGTGIEKIYTPVVPLYSSDSEEKEWFCSDVVNWLLFVMEELPYQGNEELYQRMNIQYGQETYPYYFHNLDDFKRENIACVQNDLYDFVEKILAENYEKKVTADEGLEEGTEGTELTEETIQYYLSLTPDCSFETADGVEYRMVPVDRACGSSFYVLVVTADGGESASMVNLDPYLGSGGSARWISILQDGQIGFSCLTYSGGAYGRLYRTEDGGKSFETVEYPSAKVMLSDGTYYNPFVVPEEIYEKEGKLFMEVGQGSDGDYYGADGLCNGLYESVDHGKNWTYIKETAAY